MATNDIATLLHELDQLDSREDSVLATLIAQGSQLEEARRRNMSLTVGDLRSFGDALGSLEKAIDAVRTLASRAETVTAAPAPGTSAAPTAAAPATEPTPAAAPAPTAGTALAPAPAPAQGC